MMNFLGKNKKKYLLFCTFCAFSLLVFFLPHSVFAAFGLPTPVDIYWYIAKLGYLIGINIVLRLFGLLVYFGAFLIDIFLDPALYESVFRASATGDMTAIEVGWKIVRDFCNMFYVFFLLLIAFATITRNSSYSAKNLLPKIIISMFLINFSMVIAKVVIDFGQVFLFGIAGWMGGFSGDGSVGGGLSSIVKYFESQFTSNLNPSLSALFLASFAILYTMMLGILYVMLALFLLVRLIYFVFLVIVSPFAFFSMVLPSMQTYSSKWWHAIIQNSISGPIFIFFVYLSATMASTLKYMTPVAMDAQLGFWRSTLVIVIPHLISIGMLWMAIPATQALGAAGSKYIIGGTAGMGNVAMGMYSATKLGEKATKKGYKVIEDRIPYLAHKREGVQESIAKFKGNLGFGGAALSTMKNIDQGKQDKLDDAAKKFGPKESVPLDFAKDLEDKLTTLEKNYIALAAIEQGRADEFEKWIDIESLSTKEKTSLLMKMPTWVLKTSDAKRRMAAGDYDQKARDRINKDKAENGVSDQEAYKREEIRTWVDRAVVSGKEKEIKSFKDPDTHYALQNILTASAYAKLGSDLTVRSQKESFGVGVTAMAEKARIRGNRDEQIRLASVAMGAGVSADNAFNKRELDGISPTEFTDRLSEALSKIDVKVAVNIPRNDLRTYGHMLPYSVMSGFASQRKSDEFKAVQDSLKNEIKRMENLPSLTAADRTRLNDLNDKKAKVEAKLI